MTEAAASRHPEHGASRRSRPLILIATFALLIAARPLLPDGLVRLPDWAVLPFADWLNAAFAFIQNDLQLVVATRAVAAVVAWLLDVTNNILTGSRGGLGLPAAPWPLVALVAFMIGYALKGWRLSLLAGGTVVYLAIFGQWKWAMQTLSLIAVAVPLAVGLGLVMGVWAYKSRMVEAIVTPILNVVQSMPHFAYLIPVVVFFGIGDHAGAIATIIFATPPMIRMTLLGMNKLSPEVVESGQMCGATRWQLLRHTQIPTAREDILIGVNQVIMQCLAMVVIASFIGAPGLGYKLLGYLQSLKIGKAFELGVSIVLIAIALDRCSKAWVERQPVHHEPGEPFHRRYRLWLIFAALAVISLIAAQAHDLAQAIPRRGGLTTAPFWDAIVDWVTLNLFDAALALRTFLSLHVLIPIRDGFLYAPWIAVLTLAGGTGWLVGGWRSALVAGGFIGFIALSGWWDRAMITAYMVFVAVVIASAVGLPLGLWASRSERRARVALVLCDTFQTFPSFIYLIPVIMLFQVNDVSAIAAVVVFATIPMTRYTVEGMRAVPPALHEAVSMSGANAVQRLVNLELPLALPHIMVGLNQTVMFSLFMVIIAAFIGTQDLGQEMMRALSANDVGKGLVLGLCVASLGLLIDHLANRWSLERRALLGLA